MYVLLGRAGITIQHTGIKVELWQQPHRFCCAAAVFFTRACLNLAECSPICQKRAKPIPELAWCVLPLNSRNSLVFPSICIHTLSEIVQFLPCQGSSSLLSLKNKSSGLGNLLVSDGVVLTCSRIIFLCFSSVPV